MYINPVKVSLNGFAILSKIPSAHCATLQRPYFSLCNIALDTMYIVTCNLNVLKVLKSIERDTEVYFPFCAKKT